MSTGIYSAIIMVQVKPQLDNKQFSLRDVLCIWPVELALLYAIYCFYYRIVEHPKMDALDFINVESEAQLIKHPSSIKGAVTSHHSCKLSRTTIR